METYTKFSVVEIKRVRKCRRLPIYGKKSALVERLRRASGYGLYTGPALAALPLPYPVKARSLIQDDANQAHKLEPKFVDWEEPATSQGTSPMKLTKSTQTFVSHTGSAQTIGGNLYRSL